MGSTEKMKSSSPAEGKSIYRSAGREEMLIAFGAPREFRQHGTGLGLCISGQSSSSFSFHICKMWVTTASPGSDKLTLVSRLEPP